MNKKLEEYSKEELIEEIESLKRRKKFGLVWEDKKEDIVEKCKNEIPVLKEVPVLAVNEKPGESTNLIIEGDNFASLQVLNYTHHGKIDVIYIDPPYNTGNKDFIYNDSYVDSEDSFRHSKWLSFMDRRLRLAKELLSDNGVIIISIDDNEQAQLKLLCDDIFKEENFVSQITIENGNGVFGPKAANADKTVVKVKDYALVYRNSYKEQKYNTLYSASEFYFDSHYNKYIDENRKTFSLISWMKDKKDIKELFKRRNLAINFENINIMMQIDLSFRDYVQNDLASNIYGDWPYTADIDNPSLFDDNNFHEINGVKVFRTSGGKYRWYRPFSSVIKIVDDYLPEKRMGVIRGDLWKGFYKDMTNISKEGGVEFKNGKKPTRLIKQFIKFFTLDKNAIVLDFFAGSGTTGQAVLELNKEDGGNRKFILCTHGKENEKSEINISRDITYPRIKTIVTGICSDGSRYSDGISANVRYFTTEFIEKGITNDVTRAKLFEKSDEMIQVRENAFEFVYKNDNYAFYKNNEKFVAIIKDPFNFGPIWYELEEKNTEKLPVKLYVFSYSNYTFEDEIPDTDLKYEICAIPNSIMEVYRKISDKKEER
jgi:adenine-specific DNA-methyltransferase